MPDLALPPPQVISVSELNRIAREALERNLPLLWVAGEISNFKRYDSGHCYFTLKDAQAQVDCVMFRHRAQLQGWPPRDGMQVEGRARPQAAAARDVLPPLWRRMPRLPVVVYPTPVQGEGAAERLAAAIALAGER